MAPPSTVNGDNSGPEVNSISHNSEIVSAAIPHSKTQAEENFFFLADRLPYAHLLDALAYVDPISADTEQHVKSLIQQELGVITQENGGTPKDYLEGFPIPSTPHLNNSDSLIGKELIRKKNGESMARLDQSKYSKMEQPAANGDFSDFNKASQTCHCLLGHSQLSTVNLQLMNIHAVKSWKCHLQVLSGVEARYKRELKRARDSVENFSKTRKLQQVETGSTLKNLEQSILEYEENNAKILKATIPLQSSCKHLLDKVKSTVTDADFAAEERILEMSGLEVSLTSNGDSY